MKLELNCDLGEGESLARSRALMRWVTAISIACGGHAGDAASMARCVRSAVQAKVRVGAHPGAWSRGDQGRGPVQITPEELELLLLHQVGALCAVCAREGARLHYIKLHGALYHASECDARLARAYLGAVRRWWPKAAIYVRAGGSLARLAGRWGVVAWEEAFADRGYGPDGQLVARHQAGALLTDPRLVARRVRELLCEGWIRAVDGTKVRLRPRTLCVHSDTPNSVALARAISGLL